ncbi:MFS transporter [Pseudonocardia acaciae]|uniref:MFS transporter n=1 Tax=Pseudonocardia acaciae TaxID=551276 RepID=UPI000AE4D12E|nr:MFS transporter [Pseudonocardia acaciae]
MVGTAIEWYDFYIFGTAAALVFDRVFFPEVSPGIGILASFATFWAGFLTRPLGGIIFGHLGDRVGRKNSLIITLLFMGIATVGIGLLPGYHSIGWWAPLLLVLLRGVQGVAVGGEWGGAVLISTEHVGSRRRVLFGAFAQQGSPIGYILAGGAFAIATQLPSDPFLTWGWRIPFVASALLVVVGLVIRLRIEESPVLQRLRATDRTARYPLARLVKEHRAPLVIAVLAITAVMTSAYFKTTFALSWTTNQLGFDRNTMVTVILIGNIVQFFVQPFGAVLSDRFGTRRMVTIFLLVEVVTLPLMFALFVTGDLGLAVLGLILAIIPNVMFYATTAGVLMRAFPAAVRYSGIAVSYAVSATIFGGSAPVVGQALLTWTGSIAPVAAYASAMVLVSLVATRALCGRAVDDADMVPQGARA